MPRTMRSFSADSTISCLSLVLRARPTVLWTMLAACLVLTGCGSGGYAGNGITSLSKSAITIDAGQSFQITAALTGKEPVSWAISGAACSASACGTISATTGDAVTYTAPAGIATQLKLTLTASLPGTKSAQTTSITVNPDPTITGVPPAGTVGTPYTATLTATGGTAPLHWGTTGTLPPGLSFNSTTGIISGTPTTSGSFSFFAQVVDSSDVPFTVKSPETIAISVPIASLVVVSGQPPAGTVGMPYTTALSATGGTLPYSWSVISGSLPAGLTLAPATGVISGTPTAQGTFSFTAQVEDASGTKASAGFSILINAAASNPTLTLGTLPGAIVGVPYTAPIVVTGGTAPYTCQQTGGTLPAGLTLAANCIVSGTATTPGTSTVTVKATDSSNPAETTTGPESITVSAAGTLALSSPASGTVGSPYNGLIGVTGGTSPYSCTILTGTLPAGLALGTACQITGTPTTAGTSTLTVMATDASAPNRTTAGPISVTIAPSTLTLTLSNLPGAIVGVPYNATIGVSGGTAPYSCQQTGGTLPAGLSLAASCVVSGTPTTSGTSTLTVKATDSGNPSQTVSGPETIAVSASGTLALSSPMNGTVGTPYSGVVGVSGGTAPYSCLQTGGTLPAGLTLAANCAISGTPTAAGTANITVKATDSANPVKTTTGPVSLTITPAALVLTMSTLPNATVGVAYSATVGVTGGTAPYACSQIGGNLPPGLTLAANCLVSGTPTTAGPFTATVKATDASNPMEMTSGPETITVSPAPLSLTLANLPNATVGVAYSATVGVSGGTAPYACSQTGGTLPAGLTLSAACVVSGTPTTAGTSTATVKATDASNPMEMTSGPETIAVSPAPLSLTMATLPNGTVGVAYSATVGVSGGTAPYACSQTGGTLPAGLSLSAACVVSGTPTTAGTSTATVKATDASNPVEMTSGPEGITISPAPLTLTVSNLPPATVGTPYSATIGVTGGTAPYGCSLAAGTLPAGLTLAANCVVSGTPTVPDMVTLSVKATDASNPVETTTGPVGLTVFAAPTLTLSNPPNATQNVPYSGSIGVIGGQAPYTCTITANALPTGLSLTGCTISGTPTMAGTATVTVKATDSSNPVATSTGPVTIKVLPATTTLTLTPPPNATITVPYTGTIGVSGGTAPYTCTQTGGTLPAGLTLAANCVVSGTPTATGTSTVTVQATDAASPANTTTGPVAITVTGVPPLTLAGSLPNATLNAPYTQTLQAAGGIAPYKYSLKTGALPPGLNLSTAGVISGTPTAVGASSFTVMVTDTEPTPQTATLPLVLLVVYATTANDGELNGPYAFLFQGYDDVVAGVLAYQTATVASFTADGKGAIGSGELDANHQGAKPAGNTVATQPFLGTYTLDANSRGYMTITTLNADGTTAHTTTYAITVKAPVSPATVATQASLIEFDDDQPVGTRGSGTMLAQQPGAFASGLKGSYAYGVSGDTPCLPSCTVGIFAGPAAAVGAFTTNGNGLLTTGSSDVNIAQANFADKALTGSYSAADGNGRLDLAMETAGLPTGVYPGDYAVYLVSANQAFVMSTDKHSEYVLLAGTAQLQTQASFTNASLDGAMVGYENAQSNPGLLGATLQHTLNLSTATIFRTVGNGTGSCNFTNVDIAGLTGLVNGLTGLGSGAPILDALLGTYQSTGGAVCTVGGNGRGVLNYPDPDTVLTLALEVLHLPTTPPPPRTVYLVSPQNGYFLETGFAGLGRFEPQTGTPSTLGSLDGTYVYASLPAASLASINTNGIFVADGAGKATTTNDLNIGVGTINVLQTDVTTTANYTLNNAAEGRFILGTTIVLYEIAPGRFVLVDTNALTTSPSISLLY